MILRILDHWDITLRRPLIGMKTYPFEISKPLWRAVTLIAVLGMIFTGCKRVTSNDISGVYTRGSNGVVDTILLATNGTFQQTITFTNGQQWSKTGSWIFAGETVEFDTFYSAFEVPDFKYSANIVIPPKSYAMQVLWVEKGRLLKNPEDLAWIKRESGRK
jgi:hypothetical protein